MTVHHPLPVAGISLRKLCAPAKKELKTEIYDVTSSQSEIVKRVKEALDS
jgi:hypothetical protein